MNNNCEPMKNVVIVDVDHVLSHASVRDYMLGDDGDTEHDWDSYHEKARFDVPCSDLARIITALSAHEFYIVGLTSRPEKWRALTNDWLIKHNIPIDELIMRPADDFRKSHELKVALAKQRFGDDLQNEILCVFDDNEKIIEAFNAEGITSLRVFGRAY